MEKNKKFMVLIIVLLVVLLAIVVGVSVMAYKMVNSGGSDKQVVIENHGEVDIMKSVLVDLGTPMVINLLPDIDGTPRAVNITASVAVNTANKDDAALVTKIQGSEVIVRDAINYVVCDKTVEQIAGRAAQDLLKEEIITMLQDVFRTNIIYDIYIEVYFM